MCVCVCVCVCVCDQKGSNMTPVPLMTLKHPERCFSLLSLFITSRVLILHLEVSMSKIFTGKGFI